MRRQQRGPHQVAESRLAQVFPMALAFPHILVLDGNLLDLDIAGRLLSGRGFNITLSSSLLDHVTLNLLAPDLIILDPVLLGSRYANSRGGVRDSLGDVPVISCISAGVGTLATAATLVKPLQERDLLLAVEKFLPARREQQPAGEDEQVFARDAEQLPSIVRETLTQVSA